MASRETFWEKHPWHRCIRDYTIAISPLVAVTLLEFNGLLPKPNTQKAEYVHAATAVATTDSALAPANEKPQPESLSLDQQARLYFDENLRRMPLPLDMERLYDSAVDDNARNTPLRRLLEYELEVGKHNKFGEDGKK